MKSNDLKIFEWQVTEGASGMRRCNLWRSTRPSGQAARLAGASLEEPAEPLASPPLLPPARLPVPACNASIPVPQHTGPAASRPNRHRQAHARAFSMEPVLPEASNNHTPSPRTGVGAVRRHRFGNYRREPCADKELGALRSPPQAAAPHGSPAGL